MLHHKINIILLSILCGFVFNSSSCNKDDDLCAQTGIVKNYLGQDGCNFVIESDGQVFEPININDWGLQIYDGQKVNFSYQIASSPGSCAIGVAITLMCFENA
ncbi:MAG: hypothetical protein COA57_01580 [Flavobacteriales bacterium]|nr:MAG: hypothetical protein COA57_01580 [Flavobacteriales bacterium]